MSLDAPYFAICRPYKDRSYPNSLDRAYMLDERYAPGRQHLCRTYSLLERDLEKAFRFIEPADGNEATFSHELYELLLRACTEVETNASAILTLNGYSRSGNLNVTDYCKIERACRLSEYQVRLPFWRGKPKVDAPFATWAKGNPLPWYQDYNAVKHDRSGEFEKANLENVLHAIGGLLVVLFAQFHVHAFSPFRPTTTYEAEGNWIQPNDGLFDIHPPHNWPAEEEYHFNWQALKSNTQPFSKFPF